MNKNKFKILKTTLACATIISSLTACKAKEVDCNINDFHVHLYVNEDNTSSRYIKSEKEYIGKLDGTEEYLPLTTELSLISENNLYRIEDNIKYLTETTSSYQPKRQAYVYDYIYGTYYGYGYGYNYSTSKYETSYGLKTGYHWDYKWQDIPLDQYTTDKVKDITYQFKFYKLNEDGTTSSKLFNSLEDVTEEYKYFTPTTLVQENVSDSYYLTKEKIKNRLNQ